MIVDFRRTPPPPPPPIHPLHVNNCLVQLCYQIWPQKTTEGSLDCWTNHWYNPPPPPLSRNCTHPEWVKGLEKSLWTSHQHTTSLNCYRLVEHQNDQTQKQFLSPSNPSHEHLTLNVEHTTLLYIIYSPHTLIFSFKICTCQTSHIIVCIVHCLFCICVYCSFVVCVLLLSFCCTVELLSL